MTSESEYKGDFSGSCLCGGVTFRAYGSHTWPTVCHCAKCLKQGAGPFMAVRFNDGTHIYESQTLTWYASSETGEWGFCGKCGSRLFWRDTREDTLYISPHAIEGFETSGIAHHLHAEEKPAWYDFADDAARLPERATRGYHALLYWEQSDELP
jgi:hypothetical protein